jgi:hypothetical protein
LQRYTHHTDASRYTVRISDLIERVDLLEQKEFEWGTTSAWSSEHVPQGKVLEGEMVAFKNATCSTPDGRTLIRSTISAHHVRIARSNSHRS